MNRRKKAKTSALKDNTVTFRLPPDEFDELLGRAGRLNVSHHQLGKEYTSQTLAAEVDREGVRLAFHSLGAIIAELRKDVALGTEALLIASGQYSPEEAHRWVRSQFNILAPTALAGGRPSNTLEGPGQSLNPPISEPPAQKQESLPFDEGD